MIKTFCVLIAIVFLSAPAHAEKRLGGIVDGDLRLTSDEGPYVLERDLLVTRKGRLTVGAGTRILAAKPLYYDDSIPQIDHLDSQMVSIKVQGIVRFLGKRMNRITVSTAARGGGQCSWYGIVIQNSGDAFNEIAFTDVADACFGITVENARPLIRNTVLEYNNIGLRCLRFGSAKVSNCIIAYNLSTGVLVNGASPDITSSIIAYNRNNGIWCDQESEIGLQYNCLFGNGDGNFLDCSPEFGRLRKVNEHKDSVDGRQNIFKDPVFINSPADSESAAGDISLKTDKNKSADTALARIVSGKHGADSSGHDEAARTQIHRYFLSNYSPCRNAGNAAKQYKDPDGSRSDMGIFGGPDFLEVKKD